MITNPFFVRWVFHHPQPLLHKKGLRTPYPNLSPNHWVKGLTLEAQRPRFEALFGMAGRAMVVPIFVDVK